MKRYVYTYDATHGRGVYYTNTKDRARVREEIKGWLKTQAIVTGCHNELVRVYARRTNKDGGRHVAANFY